MARASKELEEPSWRAAVTELVAVIWEHGDVAEMEVPPPPRFFHATTAPGVTSLPRRRRLLAARDRVCVNPPPPCARVEQPKQRRETQFDREIALLDRFITSHRSVYDFAALLEPGKGAGAGDAPQTARRPGTQDNPFMQLLQALLEVRFLEGRWQLLEVETHKLVILQTLRILTRDRHLQRRFLTRGGGEELVNVFDEEGARHLNEPLQQGAGAQNPLVHVASMLAKLDANSPLLVNCKRTLCQLLATSERFLLQGVLASLHKLSASPLVLTHCQVYTLEGIEGIEKEN